MALKLFFAFLAGNLSILSPCVLPLVPIVLGTAAGKGRYGPWLLAAGLVVSFVVIGLFVSLIGFSIGLDGAFFRKFSAVILLALGLLLAVPLLQQRFAGMAGPLGNWLDQKAGGGAAGGQFGIGVLLGAVWSPCVGPTLGAASVLAAQGHNLGQVALTMALFGLGVALPLVVIGLMSREVLMRWRGRMLSAGSTLKTALGALFIVTGMMILSGVDKQVETTLVAASPEWLTVLTTKF
jgi:cytochrome c-type biogenesis protein